jgi:transketolase
MKSGCDLITGSADLSGNTNVKTSISKDITKSDFNGNYINYGVREHGMGAIMNGLAIGGIKNAGSTFLVFSDYMRPAIRMAAMSKLPVIYVFTHDSICVGEDGPTHQPIEQLPSLRMIPNLNVYRPCNINEIAYAWNSAIKETEKPTAIILSRQKFTQIPTPFEADLSRGGYVIYQPKSNRVRATLVATGSEIPLAVAVAQHFRNVQVVSVNELKTFQNQDKKYKNSLLRGCVIAIEASSPESWFSIADAVIGVDKFGLSGNGEDVYKEYGFDVDKIVNEIKDYVK